jgi:hypothetical protein
MWTAFLKGHTAAGQSGILTRFPFNAVGAARHGNKTGCKGTKKLCNMGKNRLSLQLLKLGGVYRKKY